MQGRLRTDQLRYFLPDAIELARQGEAAHHGMPAQQLQAMRSGFSHARGVKITFFGASQRVHISQQVRYLEVWPCSLPCMLALSKLVFVCQATV